MWTNRILPGPAREGKPQIAPPAWHILAFALALTQSFTTKESAGQPLTPPGQPLPHDPHATLIT